MTSRLTFLHVFALSLLTLPACGDSGSEVECVCPASLTLNIGHRGSGDSSVTNPLPENTLPSIEAAMADGADGVEIDVQLSADGVLVLMHDFTVDHTTDGTGCVSALTLEELKALDAGNPASLGEGIQVPTLQEVVEGFDEGLLNVEVKVTVGHGTCEDTDRDATVEALISDLEGFPRERVVVSSFDVDVLRLLREKDASIPIGLLGLSAATLDATESEGFEIAAMSALSVSPALIDDARARGIAVWVWTLNDEEMIEELVEAQIDGVITNEVPIVRTVKERLCEGFTC
jgi:glycerophosphoryl diester phosphodiesterase